MWKNVVKGRIVTAERKAVHKDHKDLKSCCVEKKKKGNIMLAWEIFQLLEE